MTTQPSSSSVAPTWVRRLWTVAAAGLIAVAGIAIGWRINVDNRRADACESDVRERDDDRAVWLYLIDQNPDSPRLPAFKRFLNDRLPELRCERGSAIPVPATP